ncbi:hypothetical protein PAI11_35710 [Patulibacter medicamentivorans]|uniref:Uncharacterized protein n=1 Tax=Patulibacter medicamentivorans TaxID=1097667 RepID=H0E9Q1_9ACTN|nr:hypothetical protein [Patulibacter medicamentivorans]EHN09595.1 hypothetical protein PAI11_35710 [Patulibacter medicamentivorans]
MAVFAVGLTAMSGAPGVASLTQTACALAVIAIFTILGADPYMRPSCGRTGPGSRA